MRRRRPSAILAAATFKLSAHDLSTSRSCSPDHKDDLAALLRLPVLAPTHLALAAASWCAAAAGLRRCGWRYPVVGGALVSLGVQEVVETVSAILSLESEDP